MGKNVMNEIDKKFLEDLRVTLTEGKTPVSLIYKEEYSFLIEPCEKLEVWHGEEMIGAYDTFDELIHNFLIDDKTFISQIANIDYD